MTPTNEEMTLTNETDNEYEEMVCDLHSICYNTGIIINTIDDVCVNYDLFERLNAIMWLNCSIHNDVLYNCCKRNGNIELQHLLTKYNVYIKWYDDNNAYLCPCITYFLTRPDHRLIYPNYGDMTLDLKRELKKKPIKVWSLNDADFFTTARNIWFNENKEALLMVSVEDEDYDMDDLDFTTFNERYGLMVKYLDPSILCFVIKGVSPLKPH